MPENQDTDLITDQEIAFALLILSGNMTDQRAAEAVGLNPATAAYVKSKPRVRDYMLKHRALMQQQLIQYQAEGLRRSNLDREQVLARLWEIANLSPEMTRNSITGQIKALSLIVAIEGLIPDKKTDRRAGSAQRSPAPPPAKAQIYASAWLNTQQAETADPHPDPSPGTAADAPPNSGPAHEAVVHPGDSTYASKMLARPHGAFAPDTRVPFSIPKNRFGRRR